MSVFDQSESLGARPPEEIIAYLKLIGADSDIGGAGSGQSFLNSKVWKHTGVVLGYIPPGSGNVDAVISALQLEPEDELRGKRIKITLDKFYVEDYPGMRRQQHLVLCEFIGRNQIAGEFEDLHFAIKTVVKDQGSSGLVGQPIFMGVTVGDDGIAFEGKTVNVKSVEDDQILDVLGSDVFKSGLSLATTLQPALKPFASLASGVVKMVASRSKNRQIHSFTLGLDFATNTTSARLRRGSYIVVQADAHGWDWSKFGWLHETSTLSDKTTGKSVRFNYMVFGVADFLGPPAAPRATLKKAGGKTAGP